MKSKRLETILLLMLAAHRNSNNTDEKLVLDSAIIKVIKEMLLFNIAPQENYTKFLMDDVADPNPLNSLIAAIDAATKLIDSKDLSVEAIKHI